MSKQAANIAQSLVEHNLIQKGLMKPARVWHIDEKTGKRTLLEDNTELYRQKRTNSPPQSQSILAENDSL